MPEKFPPSSESLSAVTPENSLPDSDKIEIRLVRKRNPHNFEITGSLLDIVDGGLSVLVERQVVVGEPLVADLCIRDQRLHSEAIVSNISTQNGEDRFLLYLRLADTAILPYIRRKHEAYAIPDSRNLPPAEDNPFKQSGPKRKAERRQLFRTPCEGHVRFAKVSSPKEFEFSGLMCDISGGGIGIAVNEQVSLAQRYIFEVPMNNETVCLEGMARRLSAKRHKHYLYVLGVEFMNLTPINQDKVISFTFAHQLKLRKAKMVK
jgi:hypothetical protein